MSQEVEILRRLKTMDKYGRWKTNGESKIINTHRYILCKCECGESRYVMLNMLKSGRSKSCGCFQKEIMSKIKKIHGLEGTPTYKSWRGLKYRCLNRNAQQFSRYGGRGIKVCDRWLDFKNFVEDMGIKPDGKTIGRIDNDGDYTPSNCRWETAEQQSNNKSCNRIIEINGEIKTMSQWCHSKSIPRSTVFNRLSHGWKPEDAVLSKGRRIEQGGQAILTKGSHAND